MVVAITHQVLERNPRFSRVNSKPGLRVALVLGFVGFVTWFGARIVAVSLPFYAKASASALR